MIFGWLQRDRKDGQKEKTMGKLDNIIKQKDKETQQMTNIDRMTEKTDTQTDIQADKQTIDRDLEVRILASFINHKQDRTFFKVKLYSEE